MFNKHCPKKKITKKQQKSLPKPWLTKGILKSIKVKNKTYKQFCKSTDPLKRSELSKPLTILINLTFSLRIFPNCLKIAKVIPVFKKGDQQECNKYRPISLLSNISKLIEKLLSNHLYSFLEQNNCLFKYQYGFRNNHSTNHASISITEKNSKKL